MSVIDVIKYEGDNKTFIWKHPSEDFNTSTQLIVHESQEVVFYYNGKALDLFGPGRYTLETQNVPLLTSVSSKVIAGGETPFHAEVYFINKVEQMAIPWGTNSKIQYLDPQYNFPLSIGVSGEMVLSVENSRKLLVKIVGTEAVLSQEALARYLKSFLQTRLKTAISNAIAKQEISIFEMDAKLDDLSQAIKTKLKLDYQEYGIKLSKLFVTNLVKPEGDAMYEKFKELNFRQYADIRQAEIEQQAAVIHAETKAKEKIINSKSEAVKRQVEGYTYQQERGFDIAETVAANEAVGEFNNAGIGIGMMTGIGAPIGNTVGGVVADSMETAMKNSFIHSVRERDTEKNAELKFCSQCGYKFECKTVKFCPECGNKIL